MNDHLIQFLLMSYDNPTAGVSGEGLSPKWEPQEETVSLLPLDILMFAIVF
jgi:hypothetical protein